MLHTPSHLPINALQQQAHFLHAGRGAMLRDRASLGAYAAAARLVCCGDCHAQCGCVCQNEVSPEGAGHEPAWFAGHPPSLSRPATAYTGESASASPNSLAASKASAMVNTHDPWSEFKCRPTLNINYLCTLQVVVYNLYTSLSSPVVITPGSFCPCTVAMSASVWCVMPIITESSALQGSETLLLRM